jgi:hypothetical protein
MRLKNLAQLTDDELTREPAMAEDGTTRDHIAGLQRDRAAYEAAARPEIASLTDAEITELLPFITDVATRDALVKVLWTRAAQGTKADPNPDFSRGLMAAAGGRLAGFWSRILGPGCGGGPAVGPGGRGSTAPGFLSFSLGRVAAGQSGCGMAWMRCQAVVISSVQGQVAAILRVRRRPPRTRRAAACRRR